MGLSSLYLKYQHLVDGEYAVLKPNLDSWHHSAILFLNLFSLLLVGVCFEHSLTYGNNVTGGELELPGQWESLLPVGMPLQTPAPVVLKLFWVTDPHPQKNIHKHKNHHHLM